MASVLLFLASFCCCCHIERWVNSYRLIHLMVNKNMRLENLEKTEEQSWRKRKRRHTARRTQNLSNTSCSHYLNTSPPLLLSSIYHLPTFCAFFLFGFAFGTLDWALLPACLSLPCYSLSWDRDIGSNKKKTKFLQRAREQQHKKNKTKHGIIRKTLLCARHFALAWASKWQ